MGLAADVAARSGKTPTVTYRWDPETDILTGAVKGAPKRPADGGPTGSVELEGGDGSFILLDVQGGAVRGVEVVVWPDVRTVSTLKAPTAARDGELLLPPTKDGGVSAIEVDAAIAIETNAAESVFRIRLGPSRKAEAVRVADGLMVELDEHGEVAGLWLTGVPPFPADAE